MNKRNKNKGITLIALVITIVVLVILVGVSVSAAINAGLIENSKIAVENYDKEQKHEDKVMLDTLFTIQAVQKNVDLDMREGILIISPEQPEGEITNNVGKVLSELPDGYSIGNESGEKITDGITIMETGMTILDKDNNIVGRIAVLGELVNSACVDMEDSTIILDVIAGVSKPKDYEKAAMDVNRDGRINLIDTQLINGFDSGLKTEFPDEGYRGSIAEIVIEQES